MNADGGTIVVDQADGLEDNGNGAPGLGVPPAATADATGPPTIRAIAVASGKGGVGKTNVVANLAVALRRRGKRVIVIDADLGLANLDTLLGLNPRATIRHVLRGECTIQDVLVEGPEGIQIVPAASGFEEMTQLTLGQRLLLLDQVDSLEGAFDVLLLDTGAGISPNVLFFAMAAQETMVVLTPEPTALTDAYALIKVLSSRYAEHGFGILVNMARTEWEARKTFTHLARVAERFLHVSLRYVGHIPYDPEVPEAVRRQQPVSQLAPAAPASRAFDDLAEYVLAAPATPRPKGGLQFFFRRLLADNPVVAEDAG
jgi:flagellar biosynthesis protein FlhG